MENLLNYNSDSFSDDSLDKQENSSINIKKNDKAIVERTCNKIKDTNNDINNNHFHQKWNNLNLVNKVDSLIVNNEMNSSKDNTNTLPLSSIIVQQRLKELPSPIYKTNGYSDLGFEEQTPYDDETRLKKIRRNVQHEFEKENKRKLKELYQNYYDSAQLNGLLNKPIQPYISKRVKRNQNNNNRVQLETSLYDKSSFWDEEKERKEEERNKKVLYINSSYLPQPTSNYYQWKTFTHLIPSHTLGLLSGHTKEVNVLRWKTDDGYLLASASMDYTACIWDVFNSKKPARIVQHQGAVKDVQWRNDNTHILTASFDKTIKLFDVEAGKTVQTFNNQDMVNVVRFHPKDQDLFIAGLHKKGIVCWDVRSNRIVSEYKGFFGQVQDLEFLEEGKTFLAASDIVKRNSTDKAIVVWDFSGGVIISNQIYQEAYNCTALRVHPNKKKFIAQSNAGYIAIFDAKKPWSLDKFKRFESHSVSGNRIQCNFSPNGKYIGSGSSDGKLYFYDWKSSKCIKTLDYGVHRGAVCIDVTWCPQPQKDGYAWVASCDNKGRIALWN